VYRYKDRRGPVRLQDIAAALFISGYEAAQSLREEASREHLQFASEMTGGGVGLLDGASIAGGDTNDHADAAAYGLASTRFAIWL